MLRHFIGSRVFRVTVRGLIVLQISLMLPAPDGRYVLMAASRDVAQDTRDTPPAVTANRAVPRVPAPPSSLVFSSSPSSADIFRAHVFGEPLVPIGGTPSAKENAALARVLLAYHERGDVQWIAPLMTFLEQFPQSSWRASLLMNVATLQRQAGAFAGALATADSVWAITKDRSDPMGRAVADLALAESLTIAATFGQSTEVVRRLRARETSGGRRGRE